eukprot:11385548-Ditylum_brightwellii.AAC.1
MKSWDEIIQAMKMFVKTIGALDALTFNVNPAQMSHEIKTFYQKIGTELHVLEENTAWTNPANFILAY